MLSVRTLLRHPIQFAIMVLGIALGVAVMVGIDIANASASRAFDLSTTAVTGRATHAIVGGAQGVDEGIYVKLRTDPGLRSQVESAPLVIGYATSPQLGEGAFTILGIDLFSEAPFRSYLGTPDQLRPETIAALLAVPRSVLLSAETAERHGLQPCRVDELDASCRLSLVIQGKTQSVHLTGLLQPSDELSRRALDTLILTDIATAQGLMDMGGRLTQVDLIVPEEFDTARLAQMLPAGTILVESRLRSSQVSEMTAAFQTNLTALSLLALLVGIFLIYNAMTFSVVQRRSVFGTLRSIGYTREQVFGMVLGEAALIGALGVTLGLTLGVLLGQGAVRMVTQTINDFYFVANIRGVQLPASSLFKGAAAGLLASLLAAAAPAWEAASVPPRLALSRAGLESKARSIVDSVAILGVGIMFVGALTLIVPTRSLVVSFAGTFAVVIGLAALTPWISIILMQLLSPLLGRVLGLLGRLAPRNVIRSQSRTAVAVAALMIAVAVTIGVQVMITSFRTTVILWLEQTMRGDVYVSAQDLGATRPEAPLEPQVIEAVTSHPLVESSLAIRVVAVESEHGPLELAAASTDQPMDPRLFLVTQDGPERTWQRFTEGAVLLSEPLANRLGIEEAGGTLRLLTPGGWRSFPVAGIYADYASTRGTVRMSREIYRQIWNDENINGLALFLSPGTDPDTVAAELRAELARFSAIQVSPSAALRQEALVIFDRTFAITAAMQLITTLVAFIGVLSSLLALQLEKAREMGILRALGMTVNELRNLTLWETGLLGASAGLSALPAGYILAWILIFIINQRSFGWTLQMHSEPAPYIQAMLLAVGAALLAAIYPAWKLGKLEAAEALRGE